jgi:hypothetical protein
MGGEDVDSAHWQCKKQAADKPSRGAGSGRVPGIKCGTGERNRQDLAISNIDFDLAYELAFGADTEVIANEAAFGHQERAKCWASISAARSCAD